MRIAALSIISALMLAFSATAAIAQEPSTSGYDADSQVLGEVGEIGTPAPEQGTAPQQAEETTPQRESAPQEAQVSEPVESSSGSLPFTGLEVGIVAAMGLALLGSGVVVRRLSRREDVA